MKFGHVIEYNKIKSPCLIVCIFLEKHADNEAGRLVPDLFFVF